MTVVAVVVAGFALMAVLGWLGQRWEDMEDGWRKTLLWWPLAALLILFLFFFGTGCDPVRGGPC